ncbi:hypothetical protein [Pararhizobium sp. IMCC21322]|uniref:hypothetical protein n=1 Tax=Pararhizobium sp. IMCC21322 TaxID=3067903 RepID=UPI0027413A88|nr:hypothetical protein [Pararhizobium sp. IMCC21322]
MLNRKVNILSKYKQISAIILLCIFGNTARAQEDVINAGFVLHKMAVAEQFAYVSGVVEGLAYARFLRDKPNEDGMKCIYDWYYADSDRQWARIETVFGAHLEKPVGVLLHVLIKKKCGA